MACGMGVGSSFGNAVQFVNFLHESISSAETSL